MTTALAEFVAASELPAALAAIGAFARAFLAMRGEPAYSISLASKASIIIGSIFFGVGIAYAVEQITEIRKWAPLAALAAGYTGQNAAMRLTRRADKTMDRLDETIAEKFSSPRKHEPEE